MLQVNNSLFVQLISAIQHLTIVQFAIIFGLFDNSLAFPLPGVVITAVGDNTAGNNFTLTCMAENLTDNLVGMPELQWLGTDISSSSMNTLDLPFTPLQTSDGGVVTCQWSFTTLGLIFYTQSSFNVIVNSKYSSLQLVHFNVMCMLSACILLHCSFVTLKYTYMYTIHVHLRSLFMNPVESNRIAMYVTTELQCVCTMLIPGRR